MRLLTYTIPLTLLIHLLEGSLVKGNNDNYYECILCDVG